MARPDGQTAVDDDVRAGDEFGVVGREVEAGLRDVRRQAALGDRLRVRRMLRHARVQLFRHRLARAHRARAGGEDVGQDQAGTDRIDANFRAADLDCADARQMHHAGLGDGVGDRSRAALQTGDRRRVDDRSAAAFLHERNRIAHAERDGSQQQVHRAVPRLARHVLDRVGAAAGAGIVEQDVEAAELVLRRLHRRLDVVFLRDVAVVKLHLAVEAAFQLAALVVLDVGGEDACAFGDEQLDRAAPDAGTGAGDDGDLVLQTIHRFCPVS